MRIVSIIDNFQMKMMNYAEMYVFLAILVSLIGKYLCIVMHVIFG